MTMRSLASSRVLKRCKRPPDLPKVISVSDWVSRKPSFSRNGWAGRSYLSIMVWACLRSWETARMSLALWREFCIVLISHTAFVVKVPVGCEDLQGG